jgi:glucose 1-dehydrogenase
MDKSFCTIIPIKHISDRVPGKNYRDFNGRPLFTVILDTVLKSKYINRIIIDTNSPIVKSIIKKEYTNTNPIITVYDRPEHLHSGKTPVNVLLENVINALDLNYDYFIQTHATNPLLTHETFDNCIKCFLDQKNTYDSLFTSKKLQTRLYTFKDKVEALNHNPNELLPTQELEPLYEENSCVYIFTKDKLIERHHRIGYKPYIYVMNDIESTDIDTECNFIMAQTLYQHKLLNKNKTVLITGINGDIGQAIASHFKKYNWYVIGIDKNKCLKTEIFDLFFHKDLTEIDAVKNIIDEIMLTHKKIDCIINNAAIQICKPLWELTESDWDKTYNCNVKIPFLLVKYAINLLKKAEFPNIINIGSVHATNTSDEISAYSSSKAALVGLTRNMAIELSKYNIRVNSISPGAIDTKMLRAGLERGHIGNDNSNNLVNNLNKKHLLGKIGSPENISCLIYNIIQNDFITGSELIIDGGATIKLSTE